MKSILVIAVVLGLVGALTVMAQEADTAPSGVKKSTTPNDIMQRAWLWSEGTKFTGTTLVFTSDNKIEIKPSKEKLHIYAEKYDSNWINPSFFFGFKPKAAAYISIKKGHGAFLIETMALGSDVSTVDFKFENLKVVGSEMTGTCTFSISYGFKGDKKYKELEGDKVPVKFISSGLITITSNQPNPNNAGQPGDPKIPKGPLTADESARDIIDKALADSKGNVAAAERLVQRMRHASQEASDNPALIRAQYWLKGRNGAAELGAPLANLLGYGYLTGKEWGVGFDSFTSWYDEKLPWKPAPYDPQTWEWYSNGVNNTMPIAKGVPGQ